MYSRFENKTVIITGAGSGIGKAMALAFAKEKAFVHLIDVDSEGGEQTLSQILQSGNKAQFHNIDITNASQVQQFSSLLNQVDVLINNAGIAHVGNIEQCTEVDLDKLYNVNVKGTYLLLQIIIPKMKSNSKGAILNMASVASSIGIPDRFAYSMTKGAVVGMTLSVARDYVNYGIRCNCISPGRVHTPFVDGFIAKNYPGQEKEMFEKLSATQPIGRMGTPEEIANLALFICSDDAGFITGVDYAIDGGFINLKM